MDGNDAKDGGDLESPRSRGGDSGSPWSVTITGLVYLVSWLSGYRIIVSVYRMFAFIFRVWGDTIMGLVIRLCGYSAILFVFGIFFFVFREGAPLLFRNSDQWFQWTAQEAGQLDVGLRFRHEHGNIDLFVYDSHEKLLGESRSKDDEENVSVAVQAGQTCYLKVYGVENASNTDYRLIVEGPGSGKPSKYPDDCRSRDVAWDLGTGSQDLEELELLSRLDLVGFFTGVNWRPVATPPSYGILPLIMGTLSVTVLAMVLAVPFGLGAAVYVSEFCSGRVRETLKITIELLAAIPSIVWGFIAVMVINPIIIHTTGAPIGLCILNGGIILALMSVPIIVSVGEDALKAVPGSYREAAIALGASRWQIVYKVLFPAAKNGLLAAVLLGVGRAIGETMAVLMATGHAAQIPNSILDPVQTLTATIAAELGEAPVGSDHYRVLFVIGIVLFAMAMFVNLTADLIVKGIRTQKS